ncbi:STAS-like domain-containing protein [Mucilaginibacter roseus]|uniref:STAS-like domain-containing protein n=1 Tax=Mucilaginibacter roseus TaxID=1528868 RepID=A0ABS8U3G6_9SPHI|nr:STAS-like domain-containing protein [Mucilaginibacter roseus]MCD8740610.1 STAS-like domain-containing protein [Mucilaginibacter roseus]
MKTIFIYKYTNDFAENKDIARDLRINKIQPELDKNGRIKIDFDKVGSATQSFVHALISEVIRTYGIQILDNIHFENCNSRVQKIIEIVVEYVQDGIFDNDDNNQPSSNC